MKKICVVITSRAAYGRLRSVLQAIKDHDELTLQIVIAASAMLPRYGTQAMLLEDGFEIDFTALSCIEGHTHSSMAVGTGILIPNLTTIFGVLNPDIVLAHADRFETLAVAIAASYSNIILAHTQGGEITGTIDESVRHAVTKLAHIHFPATTRADRNILRMGEDSRHVHLVGCPSIDLVRESESGCKSDFKGFGSGYEIDSNEPFILVVQHPVTSEYENATEQIEKTLIAVRSLDIQAIWLWPNIDAGSDEISKQLRINRDQRKNDKIRYFSNFKPLEYAYLLNTCKCLVGNSSSGIREGSFIGTPVVNIGTRQEGREQAGNVLHVKHDVTEIIQAIQAQINHGTYPGSDLYGYGKAGIKIAEILADKHSISIQKKLCYG